MFMDSDINTWAKPVQCYSIPDVFLCLRVRGYRNFRSLPPLHSFFFFFYWIAKLWVRKELLWGERLSAAAKSLQSCPTLCDPRDSSPRGSPVPGILQARTLEWVAISFSNAWKWKVKVKSPSRVRLLVTPWTSRDCLGIEKCKTKMRYHLSPAISKVSYLWSFKTCIHFFSPQSTLI